MVFKGITQELIQCECGRRAIDDDNGRSYLKYCGVCKECDAVMDHGYSPQLCKSCDRARRFKAMCEQLSKAREIKPGDPEFAQMTYFYVDHDLYPTVPYDGIWVDSPEEYLEQIEDGQFDSQDENGEMVAPEWPDELWCFGSKEIKFKLTADYILENAINDHFDEDAWEQIDNVDTARLQALLDEWVNSIGGISSFEPDYTVKARVRP